MAILSDRDIKKHLETGEIVIEPLENPKKQIQPSSVDLRIGNEFKGFKIIRKPCIDPMDKTDIDSYMESFYIAEGEPFIIHPGEFALATTYETVEISNIGKMPVALYTGQRVCQIVFETMTSPAEKPYGHPDHDSKYMGQKSPQTSKIQRDYEIINGSKF